MVAVHLRQMPHSLHRQFVLQKGFFQSMCYLSDVTLLVDNYVTYVKYPFIASSSLLFALLLRSTKDKWRQMSNIAEIVSFCQKRRRSYLKAIVLKQNGSILAVVHRPLIDATRFDSK